MAITQQQAIASTAIQQILGNLNTVQPQHQNLGAKRIRLTQTVDRQGVSRFREVGVK